MDNLRTASDHELLQLLKQSDHSAYKVIYKRYFHLLFVHAYKKVRDEDQAKDVVQDVFANLWFKREFSLPSTNLAGYLITSVRNKIFDLFSHQKVATKYLDSLSNYLETHQGIPTDHRIREQELAVYIEQQIQKLPPNMKKIFEMSRKKELSHKEIAKKLSTTENNVSKQLNSALRTLKTKLSLFFLFL
ncbi:RNA polymerase sigma factor [Mucilaginibacter aquariorum]|uniref:RNA polymerase sigma-70 factor n=1 Tax=Mucilaginibacter aquariorum TaxID=2967225 RepID=A0ABT1T2W9_9SPHI|nr:RNA polymerase sigma-70 factor [Mucilaginibacter aquariorum]MCQ6958283.1 RNA polymerase sigma-70 factor [Mucilaginibacter aquariorum]